MTPYAALISPKPFYWLNVTDFQKSNIYFWTQVIGRPYLPPYWSLGFQLCRYGYNSLDNLKAAVERTRNAGVPQVGMSALSVLFEVNQSVPTYC